MFRYIQQKKIIIIIKIRCFIIYKKKNYYYYYKDKVFHYIQQQKLYQNQSLYFHVLLFALALCPCNARLNKKKSYVN